MPPELGDRDRALVLDMILAAEDALGFVAGFDVKTFAGSKLHQNAATIRSIEVVGEAAGRLSPECRQAHDDVQWSEIIGMRHRLIHGYDKVSLDLVWQVLQEDLPDLLQALRRIHIA
ncbi:HepT-like ribonuclease domain-containing protein [Phenylobacterium sp. SCN 70-31]|uniref:HepT-like ribonuclease domain-containing protein n=1 Tax=Phenylobacterium sp. SCN 70-31 TaxID=1660129 RepID=UPI00086D76A5|nr:HepT-like ribonuclease domain-containing protein [Phenylobacterium sp. SCN 70-31]ODT88403.1 MAG: hypothetical protein ABS78_07245 [Phenylobacterium sp. SCN 70-31]